MADLFEQFGVTPESPEKQEATEQSVAGADLFTQFNVDPVKPEPPEGEPSLFNHLAARLNVDLRMKANIFQKLLTGDTIQQAVESDPAKQFVIGAGRGFLTMGQGVKQASLSAAESAGVVPPGTTQDFTLEVLAEQEFYANTEVGKSIPAKAGEISAQLSTALAIPGSVTGSAATVAGQVTARVATGGLIGATTGALQFVDEEDERMTNTLIGLGFGVGANAVADLIRPVQLWMKSKLNNAYSSELTEAIARRGQELSAKTGIKLAASEETGDVFLASLENIARGTPKTASKFILFNNKRLAKTVGNLRRLMNVESKTKADAATLGKKIEEAYKSTIDSMDLIRKNNWTANMAPVKNLVKNKKFINTANLRETLKEEIQARSIRGASEEDVRIAQQLQRILKQFVPTKTNKVSKIVDKSGRPVQQSTDLDMTKTVMNFDEFNGMLQSMTQKSKGTGRLFKDVMDPNINRIVASKLKKALLDDLDMTAEAMESPIVRDAIKTARKQYAIDSSKLRRVTQSTIGKKIKVDPADITSPEKFYKAIRKLEPSELREAVPVLNAADPTIMNNVRKQVLSDALKDATISPKRLASEYNFDPEKFLNALPKEDTMRQMFKGALSQKELKDHISILKRLSDSAGIGGGVGFQEQATQAGAFAAEAAAGGVPDRVFVGRWIVKYVTPDFIAKLLLEPETRAALRVLGSPTIPGTAGKVIKGTAGFPGKVSKGVPIAANKWAAAFTTLVASHDAHMREVTEEK